MKKIVRFTVGVIFSIQLFVFMGAPLVLNIKNPFIGVICIMAVACISVLLGFKLANKLFDEITKKKTPSSNDALLNKQSESLITEFKEYEPNGTEFIALDLETTGLSSEFDRIIEVAAIRFVNNEPVDMFHSLINPKRNITPKITKINGITNNMVKNKPTINNILTDLLSFIGDTPIIAHNVMFDIGFIKQACRQYFNNDNYWISNKLIDTVKLSRGMFPELSNHKLGTIIKHMSITVDDRHRAEDDAYASAQIYIKYIETLELKKQEKIKSLTDEELKAWEIVKNILITNDRNIDYVKFTKSSKYLDIMNLYSFCRIKLNGRKYYMLSDLNIDELSGYDGMFELEKCPKSETGISRIILTTADDLKRLEMLILNSFDKSMKSLEHYRKNVNVGERNIQRYLDTM